MTAISLWDRSAQEPEPSGRLEGDAEVYLAIVGGGFTGLSTALHAAQAGVAAHVLEARRIGHGGSGRNVGLLNAGLWLPPQDIAARLGARRGGALVETLGAAPAVVLDLIERWHIRCESTRTGTIHAAHSPAGFADLERRAEAWARLGAPVTLLSRGQATDAIGSEAFHGGLVDGRAGTVNPMGYVRGLARAAQAAGATVSTQSPVTALRREGARWVLETPRGRLTARMAVLATNAYADRLWPGLRRTFIPIEYFQVATKPLGARAAGILRDIPGLWDTGKIMFSLRRDAFDRLIVGSMGASMGALSRRFAARTLRRLFPDLGPVAFETAWHGRIAMTPDHLPRILRLDEGLYAPVGYNGRGIAPGTVFGQSMAQLAGGADPQALPLPVTALETLPTAPARAIAYRAAFAANQLWRSL